MDYKKLLNMPQDLAIELVHRMTKEELKECIAVLESLEVDEEE